MTRCRRISRLTSLLHSPISNADVDIGIANRSSPVVAVVVPCLLSKYSLSAPRRLIKRRCSAAATANALARAPTHTRTRAEPSRAESSRAEPATKERTSSCGIRKRHGANRSDLTTASVPSSVVGGLTAERAGARSGCHGSDSRSRTNSRGTYDARIYARRRPPRGHAHCMPELCNCAAYKQLLRRRRHLADAIWCPPLLLANALFSLPHSASGGSLLVAVAIALLSESARFRCSAVGRTAVCRTLFQAWTARLRRVSSSILTTSLDNIRRRRCRRRHRCSCRQPPAASTAAIRGSPACRNRSTASCR